MMLQDEKHTSSKQVIRALIGRINDSDETAFQELYCALQDKLFHFIASRTRHRDDAKDVLQDVFFDLWKALKQFSFRSDEQFYGFVFVVTKRKLARYYGAQKKRSHHSVEDMAEKQSVDTQYEMDVEALDNIRITREAVSKLKEKYRVVVELRHWSGFSFSEIGAMLKCSEDAARVRHHRALEELKKLLAKYEE